MTCGACKNTSYTTAERLIVRLFFMRVFYKLKVFWNIPLAAFDIAAV